jgi:site-specific DNA recombinase
MVAAIYARKSTEQNGVADEARSVTRQIEHAKAYAAKKGWTVDAAHIYSDDGISGAEFVKRPGFMRLMNALKPRPPFQVLIMSEESRLGREQIQTAYALQQLTDAGVRIWFYLSDQERKLDTAMDKMMASLMNFGAELEREKASQRTHDALRKKAAALHVTGCKVYGYDNHEVSGPAGERLHVVRRINRDEAAIVRRIFERYASGDEGLATLAKQLNAEGVPPPRGDRRGWAHSCIRAILLRELYRGVVVWNKTQAIMRRGTKTSRKRPEAEWLRFDAPDLRIIPEELWERVRKKMLRMRSAFARTAGGQLCGHPSGADLRSAYLLSGLAKCAVCGGSLVAYKRHRRDGRDLYICVFHHKRGPAVCSNDHRISQHTLDSALLHALNAVLDESMIAEAVKRALAEIRAGQTKFPDQRLAIERQLSLVEARIRHLVEAIATGRASEAVFDELQKQETAKKVLAGQLADVDRLARIVSLDAKRIEQDLRARVADLKGLLGRHVPQTRQMLRKLIDGNILCTPFTDARGKGYEVTATGSYAGLFKVPVAVNDGGGEGGI